MKVYQIKDWNKHFENDRSRNRDRCSFVCVPNKQHGMGFCRIMAEKDGAAIYGIWHLILGACSQQSRPRNGWLTSNGDQTGSPWGVEDLALKFRRPETEIARALDILSSKSVDWIDVTGESLDGHHEVTAESPPSHQERKEGKEEKEGNSASLSLPPEAVYWNSKPNLPKVENVSATRLGHLQARRKDPHFVEHFAEAIDKIAESNFCLGHNDRGWKARFDWLLRPETVAKVMEGNYANKQVTPPPAPGAYVPRNPFDFKDQPSMFEIDMMEWEKMERHGIHLTKPDPNDKKYN
jgi:hypothetical protein